MTPVNYNGNDYYRKMLELEGRLRRSEEERKRLEERFSTLEHESRSRHETCINRVRMRYIEYLEEKQARDERNHKLLGALDRVDSSLALISAKTDRLGTMRRQYETDWGLKDLFVNRRSNGSAAGDSGVASQNTEGRKRGKRQQGLSNTNMTSETLVGSLRPSFSPCKTFDELRHDDRRWKEITYNQRSQIPYHLTSPTANNKGEPGMVSDTRDRAHVFIDKRPESVPQLFQQSPRNYQFNYPRVNSGGYGSVTQSALRSPKNSSLGYPGGLIENQRVSERANLLGKEGYKRISPVGNYSGFYEDAGLPTVRPPSRFQVADGSSPELCNDEELYSVGGIVENELERYMSRIPKLYQEADLRQSPEEEIDHEQNTSGDLLNVTLSDDGVDFSPEGLKLPLEFEGVPGGSMQDHARRGTSLGMNKDAEIYQTISAGKSKANETRTGGLDESRRVRNGNRDFHVASDDELRQLQAITSLTNPPDIRDKGLPVASNEKIALLAKNGISLDVARASAESGTRSSRNNENIARSRENSNQEVDAVETRETRSNEERDVAELQEMPITGSPGIDGSFEKNDRDKAHVELHSAMPTEFDRSKYRVVSGEERDTGNNFHEYAENLESWDVSALERKVQSMMIIKGESDSIQSEPDQIPSDVKYSEQDKDVSQMGTVGDELPQDDLRNQANHSNAEINWNTGSLAEESIANRSDVTEHNREAVRQSLQEEDTNNDGSLVPSDGHQNINQEPSSQEYAMDRLPADTSGAQEPEYPLDNTVDANIEYGAIEKPYASQENASYAEEKYDQDPYQQYEYAVNEQYQQNLNAEHYQTELSDSQNNVQYNESPNGGQEYEYDAVDQTQYQGYDVAQQDAQYSGDPSQVYSTDANQVYPVDVNGQYETDPNQQFSVDPNQGYTEAHQYLDDGVQNQDVNQAYLAETYDQSGVSGHEGFAAEHSDNYDRHQSPVVPVEQTQNYGQEYEISPEHDQIQSYGQEHEILPEHDQIQSYGQQHEISIEHEQIQNYGQEHETGLDHSLRNAQDQDASIAYEPQTSIQRDQSESEELMSGDVLDVHPTDMPNKDIVGKKTKDVIKSILDSDTESTIERNVSNTESDFDFN